MLPAEIPHPITGNLLPYWCVNGRRILYVTQNTVIEDAKYDPQTYNFHAQLGYNDVNCIQTVADDGMTELLTRDWPNLDEHGAIMQLNLPATLYTHIYGARCEYGSRNCCSQEGD